jgi:RNA polymerase sigma factor (sigma-70 family)
MPAIHVGTVLQHLRKLTAAHADRDLSDAQLLQRFRELREETAFTLLVQRHGPMVLAVCRRMLGDLHAAEDAFQATFLVLVRRAGHIHWHDSIANWLYATAVRVARKARDLSARRNAAERPPMTTTPSEHDPLTLQELRSVLDDELERLPDKSRAPLVLCYLEGKTHEQAARVLGCPKSTLSSRLARGLELLRGRLARRGVTVSAILLGTELARQAASAALPALVSVQLTRAATAALTGKTLAGLASSQAVGLADSVVKGMAAAKCKGVLSLLLLLGSLFSAVAVLGEQNVGPEAPVPPKNTTPHTDAALPTAADEVRRDRYGDPLPAGAVARLGSLRLFHGELVENVVLSPDSKLVVSCARDGARLWNAITGRELPLRNDWKLGGQLGSNTDGFGLRTQRGGIAGLRLHVMALHLYCTNRE